MILDDLCRLYDLKLKTGAVPPRGWTRERIAWKLVIDDEGTLVNVVTMGDGSRPYVLMFVPEHTTKTSGIKPYFLYDKAAIFLACGTARNLKEHQASLKSHGEFLKDVQDPAVSAVIGFLENPKAEKWVDVCKDNLDGLAVLQLLGDDVPVFERSAIRQKWDVDCSHWNEGVGSDKCDGCSNVDELIQCSVSGRIAAPAKLFPMLKGIPHAQSSGASLVSFNQESFCSYGKSISDQAANASLSSEAAFKAGSALRYLMGDKRHYETIGNDRIVFWTDADSQTDLDDISLFLNMDGAKREVENEALLDELNARLVAIRSGRKALDVDAQAQYYLMCISPNMSRLSIRFFETGTLGSLNERFGQYLRDIEMIGFGGKPLEPRSIRVYINQTAPLAKSENVPATLVASVFQAMLRGDAFPQSLYLQLLSRIRADKGYDHSASKPKDAMHLRVSMIKACLLRSARQKGDEALERSLTVSLNEGNDNKGYVLGRLFAALEKVQRDALGQNVNATIRDRYIGAASTTPARVFPQLMKMSQHHISKAEYGVSSERIIERIVAKLDSGTGFPTTLSLQDQGQFFIGYYQQKESFYTKKANGNAIVKEN